MAYGLLTNGEHDSLWRDAFRAIPKVKEELETMNKLKFIELVKDAGMPNELIRELLVSVGKKVGYEVTFSTEEKK